MRPALRFSIGISSITTIVSICVFKLLSENVTVSEFSFFLLVIFFSSLVVSFLFLEIFIFRKLRSISKQIKIHESQALETYGKKIAGSFSELESRVALWTKERKDETERLEKLESYRKDLLGNVSHELKTPIFNIQGYISTLLNGGLEDEKVNRQYLQRAEGSVDRMIAIVEDLQIITQLEKGVLEIEEEVFDVAALIKDVADSAELKATEKNISIEIRNDFSSAVMVLADRFRIRQVLVNLVVNSVRYGKQNGKTTIRISDAGEKINIEVADNGIGISEKHLPRIFERFYRADKSRSRELGGTGLGLAIVKHIIEAHNQTISVVSTDGVGSVFSFTLKKA